MRTRLREFRDGFCFFDDSKGLVGSKSIRALRDELLRRSDWTQIPDAPVDAEAWREYRKALRDITDQTGFPDDVAWPKEPKGD